MNRQTIIDCIMQPNSGQMVRNLIHEYCIERGKDENMTNDFIGALFILNRMGDNLLADCRDYILDKLGVETGVTRVYDKDKRLIMAF